MKKLTSHLKLNAYGTLALILGAALLVSSCGGGDKDTASTDPVPATNDQVTSAQDAADNAVETEPALFFRDWSDNSAETAGEACLTFSRTLDKDKVLDFTDLVTVTPEASLAVRVEGANLCVSGLDTETEYNMTVKAGLVSEDGYELSDDATVDISFGDKPAYVGFAGDGIILPRKGAQGLALETVNVDKLYVRLYRVSDRIIVRRDPSAGEKALQGEWLYTYRETAESVRTEVWNGTVDIDTSKNKTVTTVLDIDEMAGQLGAGAYVVEVVDAKKDVDRPAQAYRWVISTDMAITSYQASDGMVLSVRSIDDATGLSGRKMQLIAENNDVLWQGQSNKEGQAVVPAELLKGRGNNTPVMVLAFDGETDFAMLDLRRPDLDLSSRDIGGKIKSQPIDVYAFTERGVYRPGETLHYTAMLRDLAGEGLSTQRGKLKLLKPNGLVAQEMNFDPQSKFYYGGTLSQSFVIPSSAPRGRWSLVLEDEGHGRVVTTKFSVEDFIPQKLRVGIVGDITTPILKDETRNVSIDAQFLYGAPGAQLTTEADMRLRIDPKPFADFATYHFGPTSDNFREEQIELGKQVTDDKGLSEVEVAFSVADRLTPYPMRAELTYGAEEPGGRYVQDSSRIPVRLMDTYLGIQQNFESGRVKRKRAADFNIVAVNAMGDRIAKTLQWTLVEEEWDYQWYRENGEWRYRRDYYDRSLQTGSVEVAADKPSKLSQTLDYGRYRLDITDPDSGAVSSSRFSVGWSYGGASAQTPDTLDVSGPSEPVKPGDTVTLTIDAPYGGRGELVIASDVIHDVRALNLKEGTTEITVKATEAWGVGAYAMVTLHTPRDVKDRPIPRRAVGLSHIKMDTSDRDIDIAFDVDAVLKPQTTQNIVLDISNLPKGETGYVQLAAVDEGILQITKYTSPDPEDFFLGKRAFSLQVNDDYGRLLNPNLGEAALAKSGGDSLGGEGLTNVPVRIVSMFKAPVAVKNGKTVIELDIPDFQGEMRLMAVAWSETAIGGASESVKVRDAVPAILATPRFMAPGDEAVFTASLDNVSGVSGAYTASFDSGDYLNVDERSFRANLDQSERKQDTFVVDAKEVGTSDIALSVKGPRGYQQSSSYKIDVRSPFMPMTQTLKAKMKPGERFVLGDDFVKDFVPGSVDLTVSFSNGPNIDSAPYAESLRRYPYGCTEQTTSAAMPLLYADVLGGIPGYSEVERRNALQKAADRLINRQSEDGAFGLWRVGDRYANPWVGAYATDFIMRAKDSGLNIPDDVSERALDAMRTMTKMQRYPSLKYDYAYGSSNDRRNEDLQIRATAYAHYILARSGQGKLSDLRYFADYKIDDTQSMVARAHTAAALAMMGDTKRSEKLFAESLDRSGYDNERDYYQTPLRDMAALVALSTEAKADGDIRFKAQEKFEASLKDPDRLHTQEKGWTVLAFKALIADGDPIDVSAKGATLAGEGAVKSTQLYDRDLEKTVSFVNNSDRAIWRSVQVTGARTKAPDAYEKGYKIAKTTYSLDGKRANLANAVQGDRYVVAIDIQSTINRNRSTIVADLLPAGFEIETLLRPEDGDYQDGGDGAYDWLGKITATQVAEARDDRYVGSFETYRQEGFQVAYIVRAVTPGKFIMPGVVVEDMYRPGDGGVTKAQTLTVAQPVR